MGLAPGVQIGPYEILESLGSGGMGDVYRVRDARLGREAALKFLQERLAHDTVALERFMREARAASALNHPNIVTIHETGEAAQGRYIVMELVRGKPLRHLAEQGPRARDAFLHIARQIAEALVVAHGAGIVHRDIKPENILVRADGYVKILDFGIARLLDTHSGEAIVDTLTAETGPGILLGSIRYMSPEQARGEPVAAATDIFSLAIVLFELATGFHPFEADSPVGVLSAILTRPVVPPSRLNPELPPGFDLLIERMLHKDGRLRPGAAEVAAELDVLAGNRSARHASAPALRAARRTVGRDAERAELLASLEHVSLGSGLLVSIAAEPGMGKTTLVDDFLGDVRASGRPCRIGRGHCSDRLAGTGAYLPVLEALDALLHDEGGDSAAATMKLLAPTWYLQLVRLPADDSSAARLRGVAQTGSQERLKLELGAFLREMASRTPIVLVIEDIHWSDLSTVDVLTYMASLFDSLRVLIVATYRRSELLAKHPFAGILLDLQARGTSREMVLGFLSQADVDLYLAIQFPEHRFPAALAALLHARTEGNPLFMSELVRYLRDRGVIVQDGDTWVLGQAIPDFAGALPDTIRGMIHRKLDTLTDEDRRLVLAGSVQGYEFDSAVVSRALNLDAVHVEERLEDLERVQAFVHCLGERDLPDHTPNLRYRFVHILYQQALYNSLRATRRVTQCAAVARAVESAYVASPEIASELALLYEAARDNDKAAEYFSLAAQHAARVFGAAETVALARRALQVLESLPEGPERDRRELTVLLTQTMPLIATKGYADAEVEGTCERAWQLCQRIGDTPLLVPVLLGLWQVHISRGTLPKPRQLAERVRAAAEPAADSNLSQYGHATVGITAVCRGDLAGGREALEAALGLLPPAPAKRRAPPFGQDIVSSTRLWLALALTFMGDQAHAADQEHQAIMWAHELGHSFSLAYALQMITRQRQLQRDVAGTKEFAEATVALAQQRAFSQMLAVGRIYRAWASHQEAPLEEHVRELEDSLAQYRRMGAGLQVPHYLALLAECVAGHGATDRALDLLAEALELARTHEAHLYGPEILRLRAALLADRDPGESEVQYRAAADAARRHGARLLEVRAAVGLSHLLAGQNRRDEANRLVAPHAALTDNEIPLADVAGLRRLANLSA